MIEVDKIEMRDNRPDRVTVTMPIGLLGNLTQLIGATKPIDSPPGFGEFYTTMTSTVFNPFWDNGVEGFLSGDED